MRRIRIQVKRPSRRQQPLEVLPLDPRDPDVVRAKELARRGRPGDGSPTDASSQAA